MHHCLLVAEQVITQSAILLECLPDSGNIAVPKNSVAAFEKAGLASVPLDILILEEGDDALCNCQAFCHSVVALEYRLFLNLNSNRQRTRGRRVIGSPQIERIQVCS